MVKKVDLEPEDWPDDERPGVPLSEWRKQHEPKPPPEYLEEPSPENPNPGPGRPMSPISARPPEILQEPQPPGYEPPPPPEVLQEPGAEPPSGPPPGPNAPPTGPPAEVAPPMPASVGPPTGPPAGPPAGGPPPGSATWTPPGSGFDHTPLDTGIEVGPVPQKVPRGCLVIPVILVLVIIAGWVLTDNDDDKPAQVPSELTDDKAPDAAQTGTTLEIPKGSPPDGTPPKKSDLAAGEELFVGTSGGNIGHISSDGQSRFLSIQRPGVGVGNVAIEDQSMNWPKDGKITGFGVKLGTSTNPGRYGINLFIDGQTYSNGCSIEVGQTYCVATADNIRRTPPLDKDHGLVIIVGEQGHLEAKGDFKMSWWFTFKPE